jgi:hypothetical protein
MSAEDTPERVPETLLLQQLCERVQGKGLRIEEELSALLKVSEVHDGSALVCVRNTMEIIVTEICEEQLGRPRGSGPIGGILHDLQKLPQIPDGITYNIDHIRSSAITAHTPSRGICGTTGRV